MRRDRLRVCLMGGPYDGLNFDSLVARDELLSAIELPAGPTRYDPLAAGERVASSKPSWLAIYIHVHARDVAKYCFAGWRAAADRNITRNSSPELGDPR